MKKPINVIDKSHKYLKVKVNCFKAEWEQYIALPLPKIEIRKEFNGYSNKWRDFCYEKLDIQKLKEKIRRRLYFK